MSIEPEDMLEDALRSDLPTSGTQARIRRRLLAAGVAVGNGIATTAAASGAGTGAAAASAAPKLAGLSWGLKVGLAAVVAIPTVGLWLDGRAERQATVQEPVATPGRAAELKPTPAAPMPVVPSRTLAATPDAPAATPERAQPRAGKPAVGEVAPPSDAMANQVHSSQGDFGATEPPTRAPQVGSTLAAETRLLDAAFAELSAGHHVRAGELIHEHETRFPAGLLQKERERAKTRLSETTRGE